MNAIQEGCDILLQAALDEEIAPVLDILDHPVTVDLHPWRFWVAHIDTRKVVLSRTDEGPINAAAASALGIQHFKPRAVINFGIAGAHHPDLQKGDLVIGRASIDYSGFRSTFACEGAGIDCGRWTPKPHKIRTSLDQVTRFSSFPADPALLDIASKLPFSGGRVIVGTVGSALQFNLEVDRIVWLRETYGTDSEDQESAYCAGVATAMQVPFIAIRVISDSVFNDPVLDKSLGRLAAAFSLDLVRAIALSRPLPD